MPLYEVMIEAKQTVVLDLGTHYTKFGFTGEASPRCIIPSEYYCTRTRKIKNVFDYESDEELYNNFVEFLHVLYFRHVLVNPKYRKVVVVESLLTPTKIRETLAKVLFLHYEVSSVVFAWFGTCISSVTCSNVCLCVDIGYTEARVEACAYGSPLIAIPRSEPLGSRLFHSNLSLALNSDNSTELDLEDSVLEDIKVKTCFVTPMSRVEQYNSNAAISAPPSVSYPLKGDRFITVSGKTRELTAECWFPKDREHNALPNMILDALLQAPIDLRKPLAENIVITGGSAMLPGIKSRIIQELNHLNTQEPYKDTLHLKEFRFHSIPCMENCAAWLGGAILGAADAITSRAMTNEQYKSEGRVKDWPNMLDNTPSDSYHRKGMSL